MFQILGQQRSKLLAPLEEELVGITPGHLCLGQGPRIAFRPSYLELCASRSLVARAAQDAIVVAKPLRRRLAELRCLPLDTLGDRLKGSFERADPALTGQQRIAHGVRPLGLPRQHLLPPAGRLDPIDLLVGQRSASRGRVVATAAGEDDEHHEYPLHGQTELSGRRSSLPPSLHSGSKYGGSWRV